MWLRYSRERIAAVSLAEFVEVHIVLVKLPVAILMPQQFRVKYYYSHSSFRTPPVPSVFEDNPVYRRRLCLVTAAKHGGSFKIASKFEELPADDAISEIPDEMLTEVYKRIKLEEKPEGFRKKGE